MNSQNTVENVLKREEKGNTTKVTHVVHIILGEEMPDLGCVGMRRHHTKAYLCESFVSSVPLW